VCVCVCTTSSFFRSYLKTYNVSEADFFRPKINTNN